MIGGEKHGFDSLSYEIKKNVNHFSLKGEFNTVKGWIKSLNFLLFKKQVSYTRCGWTFIFRKISKWKG